MKKSTKNKKFLEKTGITIWKYHQSTDFEIPEKIQCQTKPFLLRFQEVFRTPKRLVKVFEKTENQNKLRSHYVKPKNWNLCFS